MEFEAFLILKEKSFRHSVLLPRFHNVSAHPSLLTNILYRAGELLSNYSLTDISHSICFFLRVVLFLEEAWFQSARVNLLYSIRRPVIYKQGGVRPNRKGTATII